MKLFICLLFTCLSKAKAFSIHSRSTHQSNMARSILLRSTPEASSEDVVDDYDVTCYIVNEEEMIADGEDPHVICTGEPEEVGSF